MNTLFKHIINPCNHNYPGTCPGCPCDDGVCYDNLFCVEGYTCQEMRPSQTPSKTPNQTITPTVTKTATPSSTATKTPGPTPTATKTATPTATETPGSTPTVTKTATPTLTATKTPGSTPTATKTATPIATETPAVTPTVTKTATPIATETPTVTPTVTKTATPIATETPTVTPTNATFLAGANSANFNLYADWNGQNGNVTTVGSNGGPSPYGTYDQNGNVFEWNDLNNTTGSSRGVRGGSWAGLESDLSSSKSTILNPLTEGVAHYGFRLASRYSTPNPLNLPYFVSVGDINNSNDSTGYGSVSYNYTIGQYLVTNCEYAEFLNAVESTYIYGLYNTSMGDNARGGITRSGSNGSFTYAVKTDMENKPVLYVSWFDCARYCNWLHNGKGSGSTETGAYTLNGATSGNVVPSNSGAKYHLPTENEWYKAAYYKGGGTNSGYWTYATQSDTEPTYVNADINGNGPVASNYSCP